MQEIISVLHEMVVFTTEILINLFELFGALIILYIGVVVFIKFFKLKFIKSSTELRIRFGRTIALGLLFFLAAEIFRMVTIRNTDDLIIVGAIIVLHVIISLLIAWEVDHGLKVVKEEKEMDRDCESGDCEEEDITSRITR